MVFFDTNVFVYAVSAAEEDQENNHGQTYESIQVINPFV